MCSECALGGRAFVSVQVREVVRLQKAEEACRKAAEEAGLAAATKTWPRAGWYVAGVGRPVAPSPAPPAPLPQSAHARSGLQGLLTQAF